MSEPEQLQESFEQRSWLASPALFACWASNGRWQLAPHLALLDDLLLDAAAGGQRVAAFMPPRHGKSELVSQYFPAWYLGTFPDRRVILASYEADFAAGWGAKARDLLERTGPAFGVRIKADSSARHRWDIHGHDGGMITAGAGGPITGRGAHVLILDDLVKNHEEAHSRLQRERVWDWYRSVAYTRLEPGGSLILIQTRWHEADLAGRLLAEEPDRWRVLSLPALAEESDPIGRQEGEALWPARYPQAALDETRATLGGYLWSALYQQRPAPEAGAVFRREWFRTFEDRGDAYRFGDATIPKARSRRFCTVDLAVSTSTQADYTVIATWAVTPHNDLLLIDLLRDRLEAPDIVPAIRRVYEQHRPAQIGVERAGFQLALIQEARRSGLPIQALNPDLDKLSRALPAAARMEGGQVAWPADAPWRDTLEAELLAFPHGRFDDCVDVLGYAAGEVARGGFGEVTIGIADGVIRRPWDLDPAEQMAVRFGATLYGPRAEGRQSPRSSDRSHR
jgi:predicted phage terminase large subunit-like protein